jgi:rhodanese-related sulfurtransferase
MKKFALAWALLSVGAFVLPNCGDEQENNGQAESKVEPGSEGAQFESKVKKGGKPSVSTTLCKGFSESALTFFQGQLTGGEREVFATELKQRLDTAEPTLVVDVRSVSEYSAAHIPTAVSLPLDQLFAEQLCAATGRHCDGHGHGDDDHDDDDDDDDDDHDDRSVTTSALASTRPTGCSKPPVLPTDGTPIVLVSANGHAAGMAAGVLGAMGYNVYTLRFGMIAWAGSTDVQIHRADKTQRIQGLNGALEQ